MQNDGKFLDILEMWRLWRSRKFGSKRSPWCSMDCFFCENLEETALFFWHKTWGLTMDWKGGFRDLCNPRHDHCWSWLPMEKIWAEMDLNDRYPKRNLRKITMKRIAQASINWLVVGPPLWKILVNWDDYSQLNGKIKNGNQTTNQIKVVNFNQFHIASLICERV